MTRDPARRFSDRVEYYAQFRPSYPETLIAFLKQLGLGRASLVADIGSGTGILSELILQCGSTVFGVEPNDEMRRAAETLLGGYENFRSVAGKAETTTLHDEAVDFVVAAQAFHWFDRPATKSEFRRILKPQGCAVLIWNTRKTESTPFLRAYEELLVRFGTDYTEVHHTSIDETVLKEFFDGNVEKRVFENSQSFDFEGLKGRLLSSSYIPMEGHPNYEPMLAELDRIFRRYRLHGSVTFLYDTEVYFGKL